MSVSKQGSENTYDGLRARHPIGGPEEELSPKKQEHRSAL
jgi:hypothetical protein